MHVYREYVLFKSLYVTHQCTSEATFSPKLPDFLQISKEIPCFNWKPCKQWICSEFSSLMRISLCISSSKPTCISSQSSWTDRKRFYLASLKTQRGSTGARGEAVQNENDWKLSFTHFATLPLLNGICGELFSIWDSLRHAVKIQIDCDTDNKRKFFPAVTVDFYLATFCTEASGCAREKHLLPINEFSSV